MAKVSLAFYDLLILLVLTVTAAAPPKAKKCTFTKDPFLPNCVQKDCDSQCAGQFRGKHAHGECDGFTPYFSCICTYDCP
ncbi:hypothetical protein Q3G72_034404 [Acer saccharum]|nr:hypothetical protein Q3G72_034404 [Acer saccharum]